MKQWAIDGFLLIRRMTLLAGVIYATTVAGSDQTIGFIERYALADDRVAALDELVPGSPDYYYYHCLYYQSTGELERVDPLLSLWVERHRGDNRIDVIRHRQAVLLYDHDPASSLAAVRRRLGLTFNHQRDRLDSRTRHATRLNPGDITRSAFLEYMLSRHHHSVPWIAPTGYEWLIEENIGPRRRRDLLGRLTRPDFPNLVEHIAADLQWEHSRGFGQHSVHGMLTLEQLDALQRMMPALNNNDAYIRAVLQKLQPGPETDVEFDLAARREYLERLWSFVKDLPDGQNALKANVLYHWLDLDRRDERYDPDRFMKYVRLPRYLPYVNEDWIRPLRQRGNVVDLNVNYRDVTGLPPVGNDEPLVRALLLQLLRGAESIEAYSPFIRESYLNPVFAEANLLAGLGDPEHLYSLVSPSWVQALRDRVDIEFAPSNPERIMPGQGTDPLTLDVEVKNVSELDVRIYRLNALTLYRTLGREIDTGLDLDGLEPNHSRTVRYREPPIRRVRRTLEFPEIDSPGIYVIDLIGNGRSSRALLRIGGLNFTLRHGAAGHEFRLFDETGHPVENGAIHLGGRRYAADETGRIRIPYSTDPGRRAIVLEQGDRVAFDHFEHAAEGYAFQIGAHIERESLIAHELATVIVRPVLRLNGVRMPLGLLDDVRLTLVSTDLEGVSSSQVVESFELEDEIEAVHTFRVPPRLRSLQVTLEARIQPLTADEPQTVIASRQIKINQIADTTHLAMPLLSRDGDDYVLQMRGRNGEVLDGYAVSLRVRHRDFTTKRSFALQSGDDGKIHLGPLPDIAAISVTTPERVTRRWPLESIDYSYPAALTATTGQTVLIPWPDRSGALSRSTAGLLERIDGTYAFDRFEHLALKEGYLAISDLPAGDYEVVLKRHDRRIPLYISDGESHAGQRVHPLRTLDATPLQPVALREIDDDADGLMIRLTNASPRTRVHVVATHYAPAFDAFTALHGGGRPEPRVVRLPVHGAVYLSGRDIGDEYRYVLDRRAASKYPGVMLSRPGLLLNPWALRETETGIERAAEGDAFEARRRTVPRHEPAAPRRALAHRAPVPPEDLADVDFLSRPAVVLGNLRPDADGVVRIERRHFGYRGWIHVVVIDGDDTLVRQHGLRYREMPLRERRLARALDPRQPVIQRRTTSILTEGGTLRFDDPTDADLEVYDSLASVFRLYMTLAAQTEDVETAVLEEFRFLTEWPNLDAARRRELYSRYASHELNLFLYHKDREFFDAVVRPYLNNKKDKTFIDHYLLDADLRPYRERWRFAQLNTLERILLGRRLDEHRSVGRHVDDQWALLPPDVETDNRLFDFALQGGALEPETQAIADPFSVTETRSPVMMRGLHAARAPSPAPAPAGAAVADAVMPVAEMAFDAPDLERAVADRREVRALYLDVAPTREWAENNYYHVPISDVEPGLVPVNPFWRDYATHDPATPFRSAYFPHAGATVNEMLLALAVLDLPFEGGRHRIERDDGRVVWRTDASAIVFSRRILPVDPVSVEDPVLVGQRVFIDGERTRAEQNEWVDRYIHDGFVVQTVYGLRLVLSNPTSSPQRLDLLAQIPEGAIAVGGHRATTGRHVRLDPFETTSIEILFYFPEPGRYAHFPVHVARGDQLMAAADPLIFEVAAEGAGPDTESWNYISQQGSLDDVLAYLDAANLEAVDLDRIAWRMRDADAYNSILTRLDQRHVYNNALWSYGVYHDDVPVIRQFLQFNRFADRCGAWLESTLLSVDPVIRRRYQHLEYAPLVNARAHRLGPDRRIVNEPLRRQYRSLLDILAHRERLDDADRLAVSYYLLVQDRIADCLDQFEQIDPEALETRLQYDAMDAHLALFTADYDRARTIAVRYADYPVERWAGRFSELLAYLDAIEGNRTDTPLSVGMDDRDRRQDHLAGSEPALELELADGRLVLGYANLDSVTVNFYRMDIELLFSSRPFVQNYDERFAFVQPNRSEQIRLDPDGRTHAVAIPDDLRRLNLMVEVVGNGLRRSRIVFSNAMDVRIVEGYGRLQVLARDDDTPLAGTYVKVYARDRNGAVAFHKDGYTDPRGQFDYATVSGPRAGGAVERFSLLVLSETHGAVIREAQPPQR